ncbi:MAG: YlxR family protein [Armatimonadetes bacterium]|nr:YlxR family protein [Armatimonadota bacterium]
MALPERTCISCRKKAAQSEFFRVRRDARNETGRSAYVCPTISCIEAISVQKLGRALKDKVLPETAELLKQNLICKLR